MRCSHEMFHLLRKKKDWLLVKCEAIRICFRRNACCLIACLIVPPSHCMGEQKSLDYNIGCRGKCLMQSAVLDFPSVHHLFGSEVIFVTPWVTFRTGATVSWSLLSHAQVTHMKVMQQSHFKGLFIFFNNFCCKNHCKSAQTCMNDKVIADTCISHFSP